MVEKKEQPFPEESSQTKKGREKVKSHLSAIDRCMTRQALARKGVEIHRWIVGRAGERVVLPKRSILFSDGNQKIAKVSKRVVKLMELIQQR